MKRLVQIAAAFAGLVMAVVPAAAQTFSQPQRDEIGAIVREYLLAHPELLQEIATELDKRQNEAKEAKGMAAVREHSETILNSPRQVVIGNPQGDVTLVEFFDYNCGYCKRAMADMLDLMKSDSKLRIVLKEFPVLGDSSVEAARVAVAVRMQDKSGKKYLDFHQKLLGTRGEANRARALAVAKEVGMDMARLEKDIASDEVKATLEESFKLADALGLTGTPSYVAGNSIIIGAVGVDELRQKVKIARCGNAQC